MAKILLVEDDNNLREIFEMRLKAEGYDIVTAHDGEEALVVALKEKPELVITDVMMPKLSGFEMVETMRGTPDLKNIKVIMMTALGQAEDRAQGEKLGVSQYLVKSQVTLEDFVNAVHKALEGGSDTSTPLSEQASPTAPIPPSGDPPIPSADPATAPVEPASTTSVPVDPVPPQPPADIPPSPIPPANEPPASVAAAIPDQPTKEEESSEVSAKIDHFVENDLAAATPPETSEPAKAEETPPTPKDSTLAAGQPTRPQATSDSSKQSKDFDPNSISL